MQLDVIAAAFLDVLDGRPTADIVFFKRFQVVVVEDVAVEPHCGYLSAAAGEVLFQASNEYPSYPDDHIATGYVFCWRDDDDGGWFPFMSLLRVEE